MSDNERVVRILPDAIKAVKGNEAARMRMSGWLASGEVMFHHDEKLLILTMAGLAAGMATLDLETGDLQIETPGQKPETEVVDEEFLAVAVSLCQHAVFKMAA